MGFEDSSNLASYFTYLFGWNRVHLFKVEFNTAGHCTMHMDNGFLLMSAFIKTTSSRPSNDKQQRRWSFI
jgi:hypothetical protein